MIVDDRIELMDEVIKQLEDYWYSEDPKLEDEITRITNEDLLIFDGSCSHVNDITPLFA